jgi:hypothetical protein
MIPYTSATAARLVRLSVNTTGTSARATATTDSASARVVRTTGRRASSRGIGLGSRTARHVDGSRRVRRPAPAGVNQTATTTTTNSTG